MTPFQTPIKVEADMLVSADDKLITTMPGVQPHVADFIAAACNQYEAAMTSLTQAIALMPDINPLRAAWLLQARQIVAEAHGDKPKDQS